MAEPMQTQFPHWHNAYVGADWQPLRNWLATLRMKQLWHVWSKARVAGSLPVGSTSRDPALCSIHAIPTTLTHFLAVQHGSPADALAWIKATTGYSPDGPPPETTARPETPPMTTTTHAPGAGLAPAVAALTAAIAELSGNTLDESKVAEIADGRIANGMVGLFAKVQAEIDRLSVPTRVTFQPTPDAPPRDLGVVHSQFPRLLRWMQARSDDRPLNIWLWGPPGTGKTSAARAAAAAVDVPFYTVSAVDGKHEFVGYTDAMGRLVQTAFREAWTNGGVFLADELDASFAAAVMCLNSALANGIVTFPGDTLPTPRHPKCWILVGANTRGTGGDINTNTSTRFAFSTLDRFVYLEWAIDETFEVALARNPAWCKRVQAARKWLAGANIKGVQITPRATFKGEALLALGEDVETVDMASWAFALTPDQYRTACASLPKYTAPKELA